MQLVKNTRVMASQQSSSFRKDREVLTGTGISISLQARH